MQLSFNGFTTILSIIGDDPHFRHLIGISGMQQCAGETTPNIVSHMHDSGCVGW
jgi:hypothetical protein